MQNIKILLFTIITGSVCGINASEPSADKLKSLRTIINNCDKTNVTMSTVHLHFDMHDKKITTANQMINLLDESINDLKLKKQEHPESWCDNCQILLDVLPKEAKYYKRAAEQIGGDKSLAEHQAFMIKKAMMQVGFEQLLTKVIIPNIPHIIDTTIDIATSLNQQKVITKEEKVQLIKTSAANNALIKKRLEEREKISENCRQRYSEKS
jgi:hypothetical protein